MPRTPDEDADRLMALLDVGLQALRADDDDGCIMALEEALKSAQALPQRVIALPDLSKK